MAIAISLRTVISLISFVFSISTMLNIGLASKLEVLTHTFRQYRLLLRALLVNLFIVPLLALIASRLYPIEHPIVVGLLLAMMAPGASLIPRLAQIAHANVAVATGLMFALSFIAVFTIPITVWFALPGDNSSANLVRIIGWLILVQLVPLGVGLLINSHRPAVAERVRLWTARISNICLLPIVLLMLLVSIRSFIVLFGSGALVVSLLCVAASFVPGYLLGGREIGVRRVMTLTTVVRNSAISLVIARAIFTDDTVSATVVEYSVFVLLAALALTFYWSRQTRVSQSRQLGASEDGRP
jgi:BASS family bile acid:Na+ symporter